MNLGAARQTRILGRMKQVLRPKLADTGTLTVSTFADDGYGGRSVASTVQSSIDCFAQVMGAGGQREYSGVLKSRQGYEVFVPAGTTAPLEATITVNSIVLEIVAVDNPLTGEPVRRVICAKVA